MGTSSLLEIIHQGWMTNYPLAMGSILVITIFFERMWRFRGLADGTRELTRSTIEALVQRDVEAKTFSIHRLVQEAVKARMDEDNRRGWAARARSRQRRWPRGSRRG